MKFYMFSFELFNLRLDADGGFVLIIGSWDTANHSGEILAILRSYNGNWRGEFLCLKRLYEWIRGI